MISLGGSFCLFVAHATQSPRPARTFSPPPCVPFFAHLSRVIGCFFSLFIRGPIPCILSGPSARAPPCPSLLVGCKPVAPCAQSAASASLFFSRPRMLSLAARVRAAVRRRRGGHHVRPADRAGDAQRAKREAGRTDTTDKRKKQKKETDKIAGRLKRQRTNVISVNRLR